MKIKLPKTTRSWPQTDVSLEKQTETLTRLLRLMSANERLSHSDAGADDDDDCDVLFRPNW